MKTKRTPGPWSLHDRVIRDGTGNVRIVAVTSFNSSFSESVQRANAAYIVQACNSFDVLLEACKAALFECEHAGMVDLKQLRAAIARATEKP